MPRIPNVSCGSGLGVLARAKPSGLYVPRAGWTATGPSSYLEAATAGLRDLSAAIYYNGQPLDVIFCQGLALKAFGREDGAADRFGRLLDFGRARLSDELKVGCFGVSLPDLLEFYDDSNRRKEIHCRYMMALDHLGPDGREVTDEQFSRVFQMDVNQPGAVVHRLSLEDGSK